MPNSRRAYLIDEYIHNKRNRTVLKMHYIDGNTYDEISAAVNRTPREVAYIIDKCSADLSQYV